MSKETLLIVEDNDVLRDGLREILGFEGFAVMTASNGNEALKQMSMVSPDLILSDITMPEMDGFTFFHSVRKRPDWVAIPFIFLTAHTGRDAMLAGKTLGAEDYLTKPVNREELVAAVRSRLARSRQIRMAQLQQAYEASLTVLANAIDLRDRYTRGHVERVTAYASAMAEQLGWQERRLEHLRFGAILHDIGKIHISEATLFKPGKLTEAEWAEIVRHPVLGAEMIKEIPYLVGAVPVIRCHHERWDGQGYPDGLKGEQIPLGARLVAVADGFDAMTTERPYSPARSLEEAYQDILACAGTRYDPAVVKAFAKAWEAGKIQNIAASWTSSRKLLM